MRVVVSVYGYKGSGKSTVAGMLVNEYVFDLFKFADGLKSMLASFGLTPDQIDGPDKEIPCEMLCGKTPRWAMQSLGTEWGRKLIGEDVWVNAWKRAVQDWLDNDYSAVVVDDMRFQNEVDAVKSFNGVLVKVVRGEPSADQHESEKHIDSFAPDYTIVNNGSLEDLENAVHDLIEKINNEHCCHCTDCVGC